MVKRPPLCIVCIYFGHGTSKLMFLYTSCILWSKDHTYCHLVNTWSRDHLYVLYVGNLVKGPLELYTQVQDINNMIKY